MVSDMNILAVGSARVHLEAGAVTTVKYKTETDGRISFHEAGWGEFLTGKGLMVETPVAITLRKSRQNKCQMIVVVNLI